MAVVAQGGASLDDVRSAGVETPFEQRIAHNVAAGARRRGGQPRDVARGRRATDPTGPTRGSAR